MPDEVLDPLNRLMENMAKEAEKLGMILRDFALHPNPEPGRRPIVTIVCELDPELVFKDDEQREIDKQFQEMAMREKVEADRQKAEDVRQKLMQEVHGDGGIGLDPNEAEALGLDPIEDADIIADISLPDGEPQTTDDDEEDGEGIVVEAVSPEELAKWLEEQQGE